MSKYTELKDFLFEPIIEAKFPKKEPNVWLTKNQNSCLFTPTVIMQPSLHFCYKGRDLYQLWYDMNSSYKEWRKIPYSSTEQEVIVKCDKYV